MVLFLLVCQQSTAARDYMDHEFGNSKNHEVKIKRKNEEGEKGAVENMEGGENF